MARERRSKAVPIFWSEERESRAGVRLPYTEIRVGALTLSFNGRMGSKLREAIKHLEEKQAAEEAPKK
jgi:hypothetical protein